MQPYHNLPPSPGCYLFKDDKGQVLYVGKAKQLHKRVASYFNRTDLDPKTQSLVEHIQHIDHIATNTELEALILENTLIKQHQPKYNIRLKDAKSYSFLQLTDERFPRLIIARGVRLKGQVFGPFLSAQERDYLLRFIQKTFHLRTCRRLPKKPCLRYHIGLCEAPCAGFINEKEYNETIQHIKAVLKGQVKEEIQSLQQEMEQLSAYQEFEAAMKKRDYIRGLEYLEQRQTMQRKRTYNEDIINYAIQNNTVYLLVFNIYKGTLANKNTFVFPYHEDFFEEFILQLYDEYPIPKELILPHQISDSLQEWLSQQKESIVHVTIPQRGTKKQLLELVAKNIDTEFFADTKKLEALQRHLSLPDLPGVIECFDISHLSGTSTVGSMVQFRRGKPDKSNYRRFRIRTVEGIDDVKAIAEVVRRRYTRLKKEGEEYPDIILIDGGKGQLNAATQQLKQLDVMIPVIAIAKQFEELYLPGLEHPLRLPRQNPALQYLQEIRDEAHRFALKYNRLLRTKELVA